MRYDIEGLTARERDIYDYIKEYKQVNGYSPSWEEIAKGVNTSKSFVSTVLGNLEDKGIIMCNPKKYRSIRILKFI